MAPFRLPSIIRKTIPGKFVGAVRKSVNNMGSSFGKLKRGSIKPIVRTISSTGKQLGGQIKNTVQKQVSNVAHVAPKIHGILKEGIQKGVNITAKHGGKIIRAAGKEVMKAAAGQGKKIILDGLKNYALPAAVAAGSAALL